MVRDSHVAYLVHERQFHTVLVSVHVQFGRNIGSFLYSKRIVLSTFPLILREMAAMGVRFSHASQGSQDTGDRLSNTSIICPTVSESYAKVWVNTDRQGPLQRVVAEIRAVG